MCRYVYTAAVSHLNTHLDLYTRQQEYCSIIRSFSLGVRASGLNFLVACGEVEIDLRALKQQQVSL